MADTVARRCRESGLAARTITLKIRHADFSNLTRSRTLDEPVDTTQAIIAVIDELLPDVDLAQGIRLAGVSARNFAAPDPQLRLFDDDSPDGSRSPRDEEWREAARAVDKIREKFGDAAIGSGSHDEPAGTPWGPRRES